ncbi:hypothetical protein [Peribacillus saganii]|uniref:hypothetical protein n=1 Tax=Peribacillus saganii TaxID=2303992 RepID=UPI0013140E44|nr:hypothetical protein [Peribacillus saganii]
MVDGLPLGSARFTLKSNILYFSSVSATPRARGKGLAKVMILRLEEFTIEKVN